MEPKLQLQLVIRRVSLQSGIGWISQAWNLFKRHYAVLISMVMFTLGLGLAGQVNILLGILVQLANPFLSAGFYRAVVQMQKEQSVQFQDLFAVFRQAQYRRTFIRLAAANLLASVPLVLLMTEVLKQYEQGVVDPVLIFGAVAMFSLIMMLFAYAVAIAYFLNEQRILVILNASLTACWRNVAALSLYGLMAVALGMLAVMTFFIGFVVVLPVLQVAFFLSFSSIFALQVGPSQEQSTLEV